MTSSFSGLSLTGTPVRDILSPADFEAVMPTTPGQVTVVSAPPGSGKSTAMYKLVAKLVTERIHATFGQAPQPYRILWAVHGIHDDDSLGQEALQTLKASLILTPYTAKLLVGRDKLSSNGAYQAQFNWPENVAVHVVSHAHLPFLLGKDRPEFAEKFMEQVDLLVVDEDPLFSLVYSSGETTRLSYGALQSRILSGAGKNIEASLSVLMDDVMAGRLTGTPVKNVITGKVTHSLTGTSFWKPLLSGLSPAPDYSAFRQTLLEAFVGAKEGEAVADTILDAFREDIDAAIKGHGDSHRFGLSWIAGQPETLAFRCDVLRPIRRDSPPMMVLDAYAEPDVQEYQLLFPHHNVTFHALQAPIPLDVEFRQDWNIDITNLKSGKQAPRRKFVLSQLGQLADQSKRGVLTLSFRKGVLYLKQARNIPHLKLHAPRLADDAVAWAYWYAGRGVNKFTGRHVVALHAPERPLMFEHHFLAALAPHDARQRGELARHLRDTELLQMLHRGRQATFQPDDPARPRVIVAFEADVLKNPAWVRPVVTPESQEFHPWSSNPHHRYALGIVSAELLALLGAVPYDCLSALGLYQIPQISQREKTRQQKFKAALKLKARGGKRLAPHLHAWKGAELSQKPLLQLSPFTPKTGTQKQRILFDLHSFPNLAHLKKYSVAVSTEWGGGKACVYAATHADAEDAIRKLGGLT